MSSKRRKKQLTSSEKAYCVVQESVYIIIEGVATLNVDEDLRNLVEFYGDIEM
jgi:hypothetical protein